MKEYLLFIDTEASGLPKNWNLPYDSNNNWPYCVQIAWCIYSKDGREIKSENHYVKNDDFTIADSATKIHGITRTLLQSKGECRKEILQRFCEDLEGYQPLVVGHFMQFDLHMLGADFFRESTENPLKKVCTFCTMRGSTHLIRNPSVKFLRLDQLYQTLFHKGLENHHNAMVDANATASCFFELVKRGDITEQTILQQQEELSRKKALSTPAGCALPILLMVLLIAIIYSL